MKNSHHINPLASKTTLDLGMHPDDRPEAYERLASAEQAALLEWIGLAIKPAKSVAPSTSYGIKHNFEEVGFYISNGQLKGTMLTAGYAPADPNELNWEFRIRPTGKRSKSRNGAIYHVEHLTPQEREDLEVLTRVARNGQRRRYEETHKDSPIPHV